MAYKVGSTIVINDSGTIDWSRISGKPAIGAGDITSVNVTNGTPVSGPIRALGGNCGSNCACTGNCYVTSLSGGGTTGAVTVTGNRAYYNCNCNCRC